MKICELRTESFITLAPGGLYIVTVCHLSQVTKKVNFITWTRKEISGEENLSKKATIFKRCKKKISIFNSNYFFLTNLALIAAIHLADS
jgi:hypothetical protein